MRILNLLLARLRRPISQFLYNSKVELLNMQIELLDLANFLLEYSESSEESNRQLFYEVFLVLINRSEFEIDKLQDSNVKELKAINSMNNNGQNSISLIAAGPGLTYGLNNNISKPKHKSEKIEKNNNDSFMNTNYNNNNNEILSSKTNGNNIFASKITPSLLKQPSLSKTKQQRENVNEEEKQPSNENLLDNEKKKRTHSLMVGSTHQQKSKGESLEIPKGSNEGIGKDSNTLQSKDALTVAGGERPPVLVIYKKFLKKTFKKVMQKLNQKYLGES